MSPIEVATSLLWVLSYAFGCVITGVLAICMESKSLIPETPHKYAIGYIFLITLFWPLFWVTLIIRILIKVSLAIFFLLTEKV